MLEKVENYIRQWKMLEKGDKVVVGLSGGADSVCLFLILEELRKKIGFEILAVHVNHGIRGEEAKADEESRKETEKIRQVFEQKDAADKYDNSKISQKAMSVKTGDKANAGGMLVVAGVAGMIAALAQKIKRRDKTIFPVTWRQKMFYLFVYNEWNWFLRCSLL